MNFDDFLEMFNTAYDGTYSIIRTGEADEKVQLINAEGTVIRDIYARGGGTNISREQIKRIYLNLNEDGQEAFPRALRGLFPLSIKETIELIKAMTANVTDSKDAEGKTTIKVFTETGVKVSEFELSENGSTDVDNVEEIVAKGMVLGSESLEVTDEELIELTDSLNKMTGDLLDDSNRPKKLFSRDSLGGTVNDQAHRIAGDQQLNADSVHTQLVAMANGEREKKMTVARLDYKRGLEGLSSKIYVGIDDGPFKPIKCYKSEGDGDNKEVVNFQGARTAAEALREVGGDGAANAFKNKLFNKEDGGLQRQAFDKFDEKEKEKEKEKEERGVDEQEPSEEEREEEGV